MRIVHLKPREIAGLVPRCPDCGGDHYHIEADTIDAKKIVRAMRCSDRGCGLVREAGKREILLLGWTRQQWDTLAFLAAAALVAISGFAFAAGLFTLRF